MFGISFGEIAIVALVVLIVVGPQRLPGMLRSLGSWMRKLRVMTTEVRNQTGIDDILRDEGIDGGLSELRSMLRGDLRGIVRGPDTADPTPSRSTANPYATLAGIDHYREFPPEGVDAAGAIPDDLFDEELPARDSPPLTTEEPAP